MEKLTGVSPTDALGRDLVEVMLRFAAPESRTPERVDAIRAVVQRILATGVLPDELKLADQVAFTPDGASAVLQTRLVAVPTPRGHVIVGIMRDVTERRRQEDELRRTHQALAESESRYRAVVDCVPAGLCVRSLAGKIHTVNNELAGLFGRMPAELVGKTLAEVLPDAVATALAEGDDTVIATGDPVSHTFEVDLGYGCRLIQCRKSPLRDGTGAIVGLVSIASDDSRRRQMEEQASRSQQLALAGRIAGQVAHDFNNLLSPLVAYPELIKSILPDGHPAASYCDTMIAMAERMATINENLRTLARRGHVTPEEVSIGEVVEDTVLGMRDLPGSLVVEVKLGDRLPLVLGSPVQLGRALGNLITNAREALNDQGRVTISVESQAGGPGHSRAVEGETVRITVTDTGPGIAPELLPRIFEPFVTTKTGAARRGAGLGLPIVQSIIEDHNGYVEIESEAGRGTTVSIFLSAHRPESVPAEPGRTQPAGAAKPETVLVVDDDLAVRQVVSRMLSLQGYDVDAVGSGEEAITVLSRRRVDLLVLDMVMPDGIDGAETYRRARAIVPDQRAIVLSGFAESDRVREMQQYGPVVFLRKPATMAGLSRAISQAFAGQ